MATPIARLRTLHQWCYGIDPCPAQNEIVQFNISIHSGPPLRRLIAPQVRFSFEGQSPFQPFPRSHAFPFFEWGLNWCIATRAHQYLLLHAGVVERAGLTLLLPAVPGSGKSTLTAALIFSGWRLLSDEFALISPETGEVHPLPRAIPLKNASIAVIRGLAPDAHLGPTFPRTRKGDVAHLRPPTDSLMRQTETGLPRWIVFPRYGAGERTRLTPLAKSLAFTRLAQNAFNYRLLGAAGFERLAQLVRDCDCYSLVHGDLRQATRLLAELTGQGSA